MKRIHWFEFMDLAWYPRALRKYQTNILQALMTRTKAFDCVVPYVDTALQSAGGPSIVDLCSGSSGPWLRLLGQLKTPSAKLILTDKYPNVEQFRQIRDSSGGRVSFVESSVDALAVPSSLVGLRTIFTAFHHFREAEVESILRDAMEQGQPIAAFDYAPNKVLTLVLSPLTFVISFVQFYVLSFFARPMSFSHLLFTNIIPIVPLVSAWDGFVSGLRKYDANTLREISERLKRPGYQWEVGNDHTLSRSTPLVYLLGRPTEGPQS